MWPYLRCMTSPAAASGWAASAWSVPSAVHVTSVTAYLDDANNIGMETGDLLNYCRKQDRPYPMNDVVTPPHSDSAWYLVIAIRFAKPGRYYLGRARISYMVSGKRADSIRTSMSPWSSLPRLRV
jgi:hypothetical protein